MKGKVVSVFALFLLGIALIFAVNPPAETRGCCMVQDGGCDESLQSGCPAPPAGTFFPLQDCNDLTHVPLCGDICCCERGSGYILPGYSCHGDKHPEVPLETCFSFCGTPLPPEGNGTNPPGADLFDISGKVTASDGTAIVGAKVYIENSPYFAPTVDGGTYILHDVPKNLVPGYDISAHKLPVYGIVTPYLHLPLSSHLIGVNSLNFVLTESAGGTCVLPTALVTASEVSKRPDVVLTWTLAPPPDDCAEFLGYVVYRYDESYAGDRHELELPDPPGSQGITVTDTGLSPKPAKYCYQVVSKFIEGSTHKETVSNDAARPLCVDMGDEPCLMEHAAQFCFEDAPSVCRMGGTDMNYLLSSLCPSDQYCVVDGEGDAAVASCIRSQSCANCTGFFGMTSFLDPELDMELDPNPVCSDTAKTYCYEDAGLLFGASGVNSLLYTPVSVIQSCERVHQCRDYLSKGTCAGDPCDKILGACEWQYDNALLGIGHCVLSGDQSGACEQCADLYPEGDGCTKVRCERLNAEHGGCYFNQVRASNGVKMYPGEPGEPGRPKCVAKEDMACAYYDAEKDCIGTSGTYLGINVSVNRTYTGTVPTGGDHGVLQESDDLFHFHKCQWDQPNVACIKNSDNWVTPTDVQDDCGVGGSDVCVKDVNPPTTELFIVEGGNYSSHELHQGNFFTVRDDEDDFGPVNPADPIDERKKFARFCLYNHTDVPCYPAEEYGGIGYKGQLTIPEGDYFLRYYSMDASKNLEIPQETVSTVHVFDDGTPDNVGAYINGVDISSQTPFETRSLRPNITLEFDRAVTIDDNFPVLDKAGVHIRMGFVENQASKNFTFRPTEFLASGTYSIFVEFKSKAHPDIQNQNYARQFTVKTTSLNIVALDPVVFGDKVLAGTENFEFIIDVHDPLVGDCFVGSTPDTATAKMGIGNTSTRRRLLWSSSLPVLAHDVAGTDAYLAGLTPVWVKCMLRDTVNPDLPEEPNFQRFLMGIDSSPPSLLDFSVVPSEIDDYGMHNFDLIAASDDRLVCSFFDIDPAVNRSVPLGQTGLAFDKYLLEQGPASVDVEFIGDLPSPQNVAPHVLKYNVTCRNLVGRIVEGQAQVTVNFSQIIKINMSSPSVMDVPPDGVPSAWTGRPLYFNLSTDVACLCSGVDNGVDVQIAGVSGHGSEQAGYTLFSSPVPFVPDGRNNLTINCTTWPRKPGFVTKGFTFKFDGDAPNNVTVETGAAGCRRGELVAVFSANDTLSGVSNFTISLLKGTTVIVDNKVLSSDGPADGKSQKSYTYRKDNGDGTIPILDGNEYTWRVIATDNAGNRAAVVEKKVFQDTAADSCRRSLEIKVTTPRLGISALSPNFDVTVSTNRTAECRWSLFGPDRKWVDMAGRFVESPVNASLTHRMFWNTNIFRVRAVYVKCYDDQNFLHDGFVPIGYDPSAPVFQRFDEVPNQVIDPVSKVSRVFLETNQDPVFCTCTGDTPCPSKQNKSEQDWFSYTVEDQFLLNYTDIVRDFGTNSVFWYLMTCSNGADPLDLSVATRRFNVTVNLVDGVIISLLEPSHFTRLNTGQLHIKTNIYSGCGYKEEGDASFTPFAGEGTDFSASIGQQSEGEHRITIRCSSDTRNTEQEFNFMVDTVAPVNVTVRTVDPQCGLRTLLANVSAIDSGSGIENFTYEVSVRTDVFEEVIANGSVRGQRNVVLRYDGALQGNATYYWKVIAVDKAGNPSLVTAEDVRVYDPSATVCDLGRPKGTLKKRYDDARTNVTVLCTDAESGCIDTFKYTKAALAERCMFQSQETLGRFMPLTVKTKFCFAVYDLIGNNQSYIETVDVYDVPAHCSNGLKDVNESSIDCGGECIPCQEQECGDGMVNRPGEDCDLHDFGSITGCTDTFFFGAFSGGTLRCTDKCKLDTSRCVGETGGTCRDDSINVKESCEPAFFNKTSCRSLFSLAVNGSVSCKNCAIDTSLCKYPGVTCQRDADCMSGVCDRRNGTCALPSCNDRVKNGDEGGVDCGGSCAKRCEVGKCGDGIVNAPGEVCDGRDFGTFSGCTDAVFKGAFSGGNLTCIDGCRLSTGSCTGGTNGTCGNSVINAREACDPPSGILRSCKDLYSNATGGDVFCSAACGLDAGLCEFVGVGCRADDDCVSGSCSEGACIEVSCSDGVVNGGESDVDCGGSCAACGDFKGCKKNDECESGYCDMEKMPHTCIANPDADHDGIPDRCELQWGLNLNDPADGYLDPDNDGLNNKEEYAVSLRFNRTGTCDESSKINNPDSDGDGFNDGIEVERGYDPMDKNSHPPRPNEEDPLQRGVEPHVTPIVAIIFLIVGILLVVGGGGYLGYERFTGKREAPRRPVQSAGYQSAAYSSLPKVESVRPVQKAEERSAQQMKVLSPEDILARKRMARERDALRKRMRSSVMSKFDSDKEGK